MISEKERLRRLRRIQHVILRVVLILGVFVAGVFAGKQMEKRSLQKVAEVTDVSQEQEEEITTEETIEAETQAEETITEEQPDESQNQLEESVAIQAEDGGEGYKPHWNKEYKDTEEKMTLADREAIRSSYEETVDLNNKDKEIIANSDLDFSNMKIVCIGDSITQGANGAKPYPEFLQEILGVGEVINEGIGGSTVCSDHDAAVQAMSERMDKIPEDTDLVLVMGGTNDNFYQAEWQFGFQYWESKGDGTFCGDMQLLMRRFDWLFPHTKVIFFTPPSNAKIDELKAENPNLLDQSRYADATVYIGAEEGKQVVDLFNENFMNVHDTTVQSQLYSDLVHPNTKGNEILATRMAAEIIKRYEK